MTKAPSNGTDTTGDERRSTSHDPSTAGIENRIETEGDPGSGGGLEYEVVTTPVLVIGAGAAGARVAIELAESGVEPLVIGKRDHGDAHTTWAAGGVNAALGSLDPEDDWTIHAADTFNEGHHLNDPDAVELTTREMPDRIRELEAWGMPFDRTADGDVNQRYFGAQSYRRTCFVGDRTGEAMLETLIERAQALDVPYRENVMITRLLSDGERVDGAVGFDMETGEGLLFRTNHVVLAAGGFSALYHRHSSRDDENNGDGQALALEAGARLMDLEFVQFHPTGMVGDRYGEEWDGRLVTEAVRGEGGRLYNAAGERFMERYSPDQMELDARDVVARASPAKSARAAAPRTAACPSTSPTGTTNTSATGCRRWSSASSRWVSTSPRNRWWSGRRPITRWAGSTSTSEPARPAWAASTPSARRSPASTARTASAGTRWPRPSRSASSSATTSRPY